MTLELVSQETTSSKEDQYHWCAVSKMASMIVNFGTHWQLLVMSENELQFSLAQAPWTKA